MFGFGRKSTVKMRVSKEVYAIREMAEREGGVSPTSFWADPYFVGYANGVHGVLTGEWAGESFSVVEKGRMWMDVVIENKGNVRTVLPQMESWTGKNELFERGALNGINVKLLQLSKIPTQGYDDDIKWALGEALIVQKEVAASGQKAPDLNTAATVPLTHRYILRRLEQRKGDLSVLRFKPGGFFEYQCRYGVTDIKPNQSIIAMVVDAEESYGIKPAVQQMSDGIQKAVLRVISQDGGFEVMAETASGRGDRLAPGDYVSWLPGVKNKEFGKKLGDERMGWVGLIIAKIAPEVDPKSPIVKVICNY